MKCNDCNITSQIICLECATKKGLKLMGKKMKLEYFVISESGNFVITTRKNFYYYVKEFCRKVCNGKGNIVLKNETKISDVWHGYNPQGYSVCWKQEAK